MSGKTQKALAGAKEELASLDVVTEDGAISQKALVRYYALGERIKIDKVLRDALRDRLIEAVQNGARPPTGSGWSAKVSESEGTSTRYAAFAEDLYKRIYGDLTGYKQARLPYTSTRKDTKLSVRFKNAK